mgnify:CR=1 FL=1
MAKRNDIHKVLIIGSGPIIIGQACEFDYSGTQACKALRNLGYEIVLVNSNPATIMTDPEIADVTYIEPLNVDRIEQIIKKERPDALLPNLGGQSGLNLCSELHEKGILDKYGVQVIGVQVDAIARGEDRIEFKKTMDSLGIEMARSEVAYSVDEALAIAEKLGYPVVLRPAYTMGGAGGGLVYNVDELKTVCARGLQASLVGQVLVEESILGWEELELEVVRDAEGNMITVCFIENIDPLGVHTGDSFCSAPMLTISEEVQQRLQEKSHKVVDSVKVIGGCNVQWAHDPKTDRDIIIEINPRTSRSSALASKATGFPIALVSAMLATGMTLKDIPCGKYGTLDKYVPDGDYVVIKFARWAFEKFKGVEDKLGTQMRAVGEVMSIGKNFKEAFQKAIRSLETGRYGLGHAKDFDGKTKEELLKSLRYATSERYFVIYEALRKGASVEEIHELTKVKHYFLEQMKELVEEEEALLAFKGGLPEDNALIAAKKDGFSDKYLSQILEVDEDEIRNKRISLGVEETWEGVHVSGTQDRAYYYSTYNGTDKNPISEEKPKIMILGGGPNRIGQGIEFDFCSVHCTWAFAKEGYETIIINNNPETVSTDFDIADKLYFEPLTPEDVENVVNIEKPDGAVVQFGGQTAIKLTEALTKMGVKILGTSAENVDAAEDRELFDEILEKCEIPRPKGQTVFTAEEAKKAANELGYPVLVRPSYVLGGQGMRIAVSDEDVEEYIGVINQIAQEHPILVDKYLMGKEIEVDAVCDGEDILIPGIMEHIERTGVHSGDSISVYPAHTISEKAKETLVEYTKRLAQALHVVGMINIQFIDMDDNIYVIEVNPRSSRTVPYISKVTGIPIVDLAARIIMGETIKGMGYTPGLAPTADYIAIKMPVFSFEKLRGAEISLGPEMKSTGECLGIDKTFNGALYKAFEGAGVELPKYKQMIMTVKDADKPEAVGVAKRFEKLGYKIYATRSTAKYLQEHGVNALRVNKISQESPNVMDLILGHKIDLVIDTPTQGNGDKTRDGFLIRRNAIETGVYCITAMDTANALAHALETASDKKTPVDIATVKNL